MFEENSQVEELFGVPKAVVGMVHVQALPGSPYAHLPVDRIVECAVDEARALAEAGFDAILIENMHDRPYLRQAVGPEVVAGMAAVLDAIRQAVSLPLGVQVLAGANHEAMAVAFSGAATFVRAENFAFAHVADEGLMAEADAGPLLRYRRALGADHVRIFADVKKKHASHAVTADVRIEEAAKAAAFFGADGLIVTGVATGRPVPPEDVREVAAAVELPICLGSGVTAANLFEYWDEADVFIVGSFLKEEGMWHRALDPSRIAAIMRAVRELRRRHGGGRAGGEVT